MHRGYVICLSLQPACILRALTDAYHEVSITIPSTQPPERSPVIHSFILHPSTSHHGKNRLFIAPFALPFLDYVTEERSTLPFQIAFCVQ